MDGWTIGLIVLVVVGLAVIVYGALSDRAKTRRAIAEMTSPPARPIPQFRPDTPAPRYLSELQARRPPAGDDDLALTDAHRRDLTRALREPDTITLPVGYASADFVTDPASGYAVLDNPRVLVCAEAVSTVRELLGPLESLLLTQTPLVIVAPRLAPEVLHTLAVNHIQRTMRLLALTPTAPVLYDLAGATGAQPIERSDLQAGYLPPGALGRCARLVSGPKTSYIVGPAVSADG